LHQVRQAGESCEMGTWLQHLHGQRVCETCSSTNHSADAQEQLRGHHRPTRPDGY